MKTEKILLAEIRLNEANPRSIREAKFVKLVNSLLALPKMLELRPIVVDNTKTALGGNMRVRALNFIATMTDSELSVRIAGIRDVQTKTPEEQERLVQYWLAWKDRPTALIIKASDLTDAEQKEFIIKDNSSFGEWDWDTLANGWDMQQLTDWGLDMPIDWDGESGEEQEPEAEEDDFSDEDADQAEARVKPGEIWQLGNHRLMCGDSTSKDALSRLMDGKTADCWVTDPPYNVDYQSADGKSIMNDRMADSQFYDFLLKAFGAATAYLKPGGAFYIWHAHSKGSPFRRAAEAAGLDVKQVLIWNKNAFTLGRQDYQGKHEPCLYGWKPGAAHYFIDQRNLATVIEDAMSIDPSTLKKAELLDLVKKLLGGSIPTTVMNEDKPARNAEHPTMKPVRLIGNLIRNSSRPGELILDTFGGSGTTLIASEQLGRSCRMMELDPHYCDVIIARYEKFTGKQATKIQ